MLSEDVSMAPEFVCALSFDVHTQNAQNRMGINVGEIFCQETVHGGHPCWEGCRLGSSVVMWLEYTTPQNCQLKESAQARARRSCSTTNACFPSQYFSLSFAHILAHSIFSFA